MQSFFFSPGGIFFLQHIWKNSSAMVQCYLDPGTQEIIYSVNYSYQTEPFDRRKADTRPYDHYMCDLMFPQVDFDT